MEKFEAPQSDSKGDVVLLNVLCPYLSSYLRHNAVSLTDNYHHCLQSALPSEENVIIVASTCGQGDPPAAMKV